MIFGATGIVGGFIKDKLVKAGETPFALSRQAPKNADGAQWLRGNLSSLGSLSLPRSNVLYSTVHPLLLAQSIDQIATPALEKVITFTSTSIVTKLDSPILSEQRGVQVLAEGEQQLKRKCQEHRIALTILRPTMIYAEGRDANVTRLAQFIRRFKFFPLSGPGSGLRQPVHAEDLATAAIAAASTSITDNKLYALPGPETISYREMVGRIFDSLRQPRIIISLPPPIWKLTFTVARSFFPNANVAMGERMSKDMVFDGGPAVRDFGWNARPFKPHFELQQNA